MLKDGSDQNTYQGKRKWHKPYPVVRVDIFERLDITLQQPFGVS